MSTTTKKPALSVDPGLVRVMEALREQTVGLELTDLIALTQIADKPDDGLSKVVGGHYYRNTRVSISRLKKWGYIRKQKDMLAEITPKGFEKLHELWQAINPSTPSVP